MSFDLADHLSSIVTAVIAVGGLAAVVLQRRHSWWHVLAPFWRARKTAAGAGGYPLDEHVPALLSVYVPRRAVAREMPPGPALPTDSLVLTGPGHLLLIGPPGSGKTALVRQAVAASAQRWLTSRGRLRQAPPGPVLVGISAADLVRQTLQQAVTAACRPWAPDLDRAPVPHRRLVILVDGLDALTDANQRSDVINKLAMEAATPPRHWRLVVTTRHLGPRELRSLNPFTMYHLTPFTSDDVALLAGAWFADDAAKAAAFVAWLEGQQLGASARSPLLTTVAAALWDTDRRESTRPPDPAALLERFIDMLLGARRADLDKILTELRRPGPDAAVLAEWVRDHQWELLEAAATAALSGQDVVTGVTARVRTQLPATPPALLDERWRKQLRKILLSTGIFRAEGDRLSPTWLSLVKFLAAGPAGPELTPASLSTAMQDPSRRAVATWAVERAGTPPDVLEGMLAEPAGPAGVARLVAAGVPVPDRLRTDVFVTLLTEQTPGSQALLTTLAADGEHLDRLRRIAGDVRQPRTVRTAAQVFLAERTVAAGPGGPGRAP